MTDDFPLIDQIRAELSAEEFVRLVETLGGGRVYVPRHLRAGHDLIAAIGREAAGRISAAIAPAWLPIPLGKRDRALFYEAQGLKDHEIARKLGMTRSGVQKLLDREAGRTPRLEPTEIAAIYGRGDARTVAPGQ